MLFEILLLLRKSGLLGLCKCIFGTHIGYGEQTIGICFYTEEGFFFVVVELIMCWKLRKSTLVRRAIYLNFSNRSAQGDFYDFTIRF